MIGQVTGGDVLTFGLQREENKRPERIVQSLRNPHG
jgi:hypothetical protein